MTSTEAVRSGLRLSIGLKIFTVALVVLVLMCMVTVLTVYMAASVNRELKVLGHGYIESYAALARVNIRSLERSFYIRRLYINARDGQGRTTDTELQRLAEEADASAGKEMADARRFVRQELEGGSGIRDPVALSRIDTLLEVVEDQRVRLAQRQRALMESLAGSADPSGLRRLLADLDEEREDYDRRLDATRHELYRTVSAAADAAQARQGNVVKAVIVITGLAGLLGLLVAAGFSRGLSRPVRRLLDGTNAVQQGRLDTVVPVTSRDEIGLLTGAFNAMVAELKVKAQIKETFGKYIDPRIVQGLIERPELAAAQGERRVMTVLFCDMKGFTALSEVTTPAGLVTIINRYLTAMSEPVRRHDGIIDKYVGDTVMAFWGPPFVAAEAQAGLACLAALDQLAGLPALTAALPELVGVKHGLPPIGIRVGIATGEVLVGNIGSDVTRSYTVMGDAVNLASRLEGANKVYGTRVLVSEETARLAGGTVELREIDSMLVAGRSEPQRVFEVLGRSGEVDATTRDLRDRFAEGLAAYRGGSWDEARAAFAACLAVRSDDKPAAVFLERLDALAAGPPGEVWNGVWSLETK
jgi:adenylate cyclase